MTPRELEQYGDVLERLTQSQKRVSELERQVNYLMYYLGLSHDKIQEMEEEIMHLQDINNKPNYNDL